MRLIAKQNGRFRGNWAYAVPQVQRRTPVTSQKIELARLTVLEEPLARTRRDSGPAADRSTDQRAALQ